MKNSMLPLIVLVVLLSALASAVATTLVAGRILNQRDAEKDPVSPSAGAQLASAIEELSGEQKQLGEALEKLRTQVALVENATSRSLARREEPAPPESTQGEAIAAGASKPGAKAVLVEDRTVDDYVSSLFAPGVGENDRQAIWKKIREAGVLDEVIAAVEARVDADPGNPERHYELGSTYLQKIFEVGNGPEAGVWATKADRSFDAALDVDPQHWDSRFSKAVSLTFWPPVFGKQTEAIQQFEVLVGQQAQMGLNDPKHAQTHLLLGNMYQQSGNIEKAIASWEAGLAAFPGSEELQAQLELHK